MPLSKINYRQRIERALDLIEGGALLACSAPEYYRNSDVEHHYRQESFLHYLCGFNEPGSALVLVNNKKLGRRALMFLRERDPEMELWNGKRIGTADAKKHLPVDEVFVIETLWDSLPAHILNSDRIYAALGRNSEDDKSLVKALHKERRQRGRFAVASHMPVYDINQIAGRMRLIKQPEELERLRAAAAASHEAYKIVYKTVRPGMTERDVHGILIGEFLKNGGEMEAYGSIVAGGVNACCLHYRENNAVLRDGDLLLIDAGAQVDLYASDVTRTFPIGTKFTAEQRAVYDVVLDTQKKAVAMSTTANTMQSIHEATCRMLTAGLMDIGLLDASVSIDQHVEKKNFRRLYPHGTGHWLGMDVHDVGDYSDGLNDTKLQAGMCFTVEPGIYIQAHDNEAPAAFRGIGIRIEDDVVVKSSGEPEVLTAAIAKEVRDLENRL